MPHPFSGYARTVVTCALMYTCGSCGRSMQQNIAVNVAESLVQVAENKSQDSEGSAHNRQGQVYSLLLPQDFHLLPHFTSAMLMPSVVQSVLVPTQAHSHVHVSVQAVWCLSLLLICSPLSSEHHCIPYSTLRSPYAPGGWYAM